VALQINKLTAEAQQMGALLAERSQRNAELLEAARKALQEFAAVTRELRDRLSLAYESDTTWRGATPTADRLDLRYPSTPGERSATIIACDGSQIYPDRHAIAPYFLVNTGSIVLREGTSLPPIATSTPHLFFRDEHIFDAAGHLHDTEYVGGVRDKYERQTLAELAHQAREDSGGALEELLIALVDGPLLPWSREEGAVEAERVKTLVANFDALQQARCPVVGYVDRPASSGVLRTLELAELRHEDIDRKTLRRGRFRALTDRLLFADLPPGHRSGLFTTMTRLEKALAEKEHGTTFFYMNVASQSGEENSVIARVELPRRCSDDATVAEVQACLQRQCELTAYPYALARAHELAVVTNDEHRSFEELIQQNLWRAGLVPAISAKSRLKGWTAGHRRRSGHSGRR
jgi:hypothetical protein